MKAEVTGTEGVFIEGIHKELPVFLMDKIGSVHKDTLRTNQVVLIGNSHTEIQDYIPDQLIDHFIMGSTVHQLGLCRQSITAEGIQIRSASGGCGCLRLFLQGTDAGEIVQTAGAAPGTEGHLRIHDHIT